MALTRRAWIGGAACAAAAAPALAAPTPLQRHPSYHIWTPPRAAASAPMAAQLTDLNGGRQTLAHWMRGEAALVVIWATWCGPCLEETPALNRLQRRLAASGARTLVRPVHTFDDANLFRARMVFDKVGATDLETVEGSPEFGKGAVRIFGKSPVEPQRTSLPALMLVSAKGQVMGTRLGRPDPERGQPPYWDDPRTLDFLRLLGEQA